MCCAQTELKGVPVEMVAKLVPEHARKQCPWLGLWFICYYLQTWKLEKGTVWEIHISLYLLSFVNYYSISIWWFYNPLFVVVSTEYRKEWIIVGVMIL